MIDINSDGLTDRIIDGAYISPKPYSAFYVQLNNGESFDKIIEWSPILNENGDINNGSYATGAIEHYDDGTFKRTALFDIDADGLPDRILYKYNDNKHQVQLNNGFGFDSSFTNWENLQGVSTAFNCIAATPSGSNAARTEAMDINGDGLIDKVMSSNTSSAPFYFRIQLNDGNDFLDIENWDIDWGSDARDAQPLWNFIWNTEGNGVTYLMMDMNGDGLPDRVHRSISSYDHLDVQLNNGAGFDAPISWGPLLAENGVDLNTSAEHGSIEYNNDGRFKRLTLSDINGDGLPDRVFYVYNDDKYKIQLNNGAGFENYYISWEGLEGNNERDDCITATVGGGGVCTDLLDINGDGLIDKIMSKNTSPHDSMRVKLNDNQTLPNLLTQVSNGIGGTVTINYKFYNGHDNSEYNPEQLLPFPVWVVDTITQDPGFGRPTATTAYEYDLGYFDFTEREFRGFGKVKTMVN